MGGGSSKRVEPVSQPEPQPEPELEPETRHVGFEPLELALEPSASGEQLARASLAVSESRASFSSLQSECELSPLLDTSVASLGMPLRSLLALADELADPQSVSVDEIAARVVDARAGRKGRRFAELDPAAVTCPTYFVQQAWGSRPYYEMVHTIRNHIRHVEPSVDPDSVSVWLDLVCTPSGDAQGQAQDLQELTNTVLPHTKQTLVCQKQQRREQQQQKQGQKQKQLQQHWQDRQQEQQTQQKQEQQQKRLQQYWQHRQQKQQKQEQEQQQKRLQQLRRHGPWAPGSRGPAGLGLLLGLKLEE
ncbi:hypothetical protein FOA52_006052 [Chlamydomonas sp. UWO 241]|nr:hypothetical protein FOA52_006052 [Chlamydomonas sp. UWO 241]